MNNEINNLRKELVIMKELDLKPNYAQLARKHNCDWRTVKKYHNGYEGKSKSRNRASKLDNLKNEIKQKLELPGATISAVYQYFLKKDCKIGTYSNFNAFVKKHKLQYKQNIPNIHPRFETAFGEQLQFDWKENLEMTNKNGVVFKFNVFSVTFSASRLHVFVYSKTKTRIDVERCLIEAFKYAGGITKELLTDNMPCIVNTKTKKFVPEFISFCKDMETKPRNCKVRSPETKGKVEFSNRFMQWLIPYNYEFETEEDLIKIIADITKTVNTSVNPSIGTTPIMAFNKEKEYLLPLPNKDILNSYINDTKSAKVSNGFLVYYRGNQYSVPPQFVSKIVQLREIDNKLYIYNNTKLISLHEISNKKINYLEDHYKEGLAINLKTNSDDIEQKAKDNLALFDTLIN